MIKFLNRPEDPKPVQTPMVFEVAEVNLSTIKTGSDESFTYTSTVFSSI